MLLNTESAVLFVLAFAVAPTLAQLLTRLLLKLNPDSLVYTAVLLLLTLTLCAAQFLATFGTIAANANSLVTVTFPVAVQLLILTSIGLGLREKAEVPSYK